jgi:transposase
LDPQDRIAELEAALAAKDAQIAAQSARIAELEQRVAELLEQAARLSEKLGQNSRNSNKPPSSDPPGAGARTERSGGSGRKRGGQRGHRGRYRELLPVDKVNEVKNHYPAECESCWEPLPETPDPGAARFQTAEIPPIVPHVTEHRFHSVTCTCGFTTRAKCEEQFRSSPFGPRLMSLVGLLVGVYHISRRKTVSLLADVLGLRISLGAISAVEERVSKAVAPGVAEAWQKVHEAPVKHTDGTVWAQAGKALSLWTIATTMVTVFKVVATGSKNVLRPLYGELDGILVSNRAKALNFWAMERRQICWAHLLRKFVSFSERDGPAGVAGRELLQYAGVMFQYWHDFKVGKLSRDQLQAWMVPLREQLESLLERTVAAGIREVSGSCEDILEHKAALWTFLTTEGVEPTNNHAERELRAFVLWRKRSFGAQSERGHLFAERLMTVAHTARKQCRNVLAFLTACCQAHRDGAPAPSLFGKA